MVYRSLYDFIELRRKFQLYEGNLGGILKDIIKILEKKDKTREDSSVLAFQSPRIIRALVDYKNNNPSDKNLLKLLREGVKVSLKVYKEYNNPKTKEDVLKLREKIILRGYEDLLKMKLRQHQDQINLIMSQPKLSQKAAMKLNRLVGSEKAILLVMGHGGINVGMDVFLRYREISHKNNVLFYVVRFSSSPYKRYKDKVPQLTPAEVKYLQKEARGKKVIVYDENTFTGATIKNVKKYLSKNVFPHHKISVLYNMDTSED